MLFVESYDAKSLDRSSVSMIDKYNGRLNIIGMLLTRLSTLIDNLLSLIRDIRNTLGQCKQRVYDNLNQVKEVISGNGIQGTEGTIKVIEDSLAAGDKAIERAEATLSDVQGRIECNESSIPTQTPENDCGETCNEESTTEVNDDCMFCNVNTSVIGDTDITTTTCQYDFECQNNMACDEDMSSSNPRDTPIFAGCTVSVVVDDTGGCSYTVVTDERCNEVSSKGDVPISAENDCTFTCTHSTECHESAMPENCTYTCIDSGCNYTGNDCIYGTICNESCDQTDAEIEACGNCGEGYGCGDWSEFCGEVGGGSSTGGSEDCGECGDCGDCGNCGEGAGCGDWSEFLCGE